MCFKLILVDRSNNFTATEYPLGVLSNGTQSIPKRYSANVPGVAIGGALSANYVYYVSTGNEMLMQELNGNSDAMPMSNFFKQKFDIAVNSSIATADSSVLWYGFVAFGSTGVGRMNSVKPDNPPEILARNVDRNIGPLTTTEFGQVGSSEVRNKYVIYMHQGMLTWFPIVPGLFNPARSSTHGGPDQVVCALCNTDHRQELFYADTDNKIWHRWESPNDVNSQAPPTFSDGPATLNGCYVNPNKVKITGARNADGRLEIFYLGQDNYIYHAWQTGNEENGLWSMPMRLYNEADGIDVAVTYNSGEERIEAYILTNTQQIKVMHQVSSGGWNDPIVIHTLHSDDNAQFLTVARGDNEGGFIVIAN